MSTATGGEYDVPAEPPVTNAAPQAGDVARAHGGTAWQPGLQSSIPAALLPLVTLYREEHAYRSYADCQELSGFTGLKALDLVALRPERLVVHELLVRVTADLSVPDGSDYGVLGVNLRSMVNTIFTHHVQPQLPDIVEAFESERRRASEFIDEQLTGRIFHASSSSTEAAPASAAPRSFWSRLFGGSSEKSHKSGNASRHRASSAHDDGAGDTAAEISALEHWKGCVAEIDTPLERCCTEALIKTVGTIIGFRGRLLIDREVLVRLATDQACKRLGSALVSRLVDPLFEKAVTTEGYRCLPSQSEPVIMNVKGASASGKSTIRPQQRRLAEKLGIPWSDFALISPDYWRKYLLDYASLGEHYKYGAMLTGQELEIIDKKLDRYMASKASEGTLSHLLIDRFRFDSFTLEKRRAADSRLLTRFGNRIFLFFMITPPAETVERAWKRGLTTGRYKAVDDLLFHNIEAYEGIPALFLSWITADDKQIHVEFLDNDVPEGQLPETAAFGWNDLLTILDVNLMMNIDRFRKVDVSAGSAAEVFSSSNPELQDNLGFIRRCIDTIAEVRFADRVSAELYALVRQGKLVWWNAAYIEHQSEASGVKAALQALGYVSDTSNSASHEAPVAIDLVAEQQVTVGHWGSSEKARR